MPTRGIILFWIYAVETKRTETTHSYVQSTHSRAETRSKRKGKEGSSWLVGGCCICCYWSSNTFQNLIKSCLVCVTSTAPAVMPESLAACLHNTRSLYRPRTSLQLHTSLYCGCICQFCLGSQVWPVSSHTSIKLAAYLWHTLRCRGNWQQ